MKSNLLNNHLETSRIALKKHTYERAMTILRTTEIYEDQNLKGYMNEQLIKAVENMKSALSGEQGSAIKKQAFESALIGIRKGTMQYENDPMLPILMKEIEGMEESANKLSDA